jgi:hypothetical protein
LLSSAPLRSQPREWDYVVLSRLLCWANNALISRTVIPLGTFYRGTQSDSTPDSLVKRAGPTGRSFQPKWSPWQRYRRPYHCRLIMPFLFASNVLIHGQGLFLMSPWSGGAQAFPLGGSLG